MASGPTTLSLPFWVYDSGPTALGRPPLALGAEYPAQLPLRNQLLDWMGGCRRATWTNRVALCVFRTIACLYKPLRLRPSPALRYSGEVYSHANLTLWICNNEIY